MNGGGQMKIICEIAMDDLGDAFAPGRRSRGNGR